MIEQKKQNETEKVDWKNKTPEEIMDIFGKEMEKAFPKGLILEAVNRAVIVTLIKKEIVTIEELIDSIKNLDILLKKNAPPPRQNVHNIVLPANPSFDPRLLSKIQKKEF